MHFTPRHGTVLIQQECYLTFVHFIVLNFIASFTVSNTEYATARHTAGDLANFYLMLNKTVRTNVKDMQIYHKTEFSHKNYSSHFVRDSDMQKTKDNIIFLRNTFSQWYFVKAWKSRNGTLNSISNHEKLLLTESNQENLTYGNPKIQKPYSKTEREREKTDKARRKDATMETQNMIKMEPCYVLERQKNPNMLQRCQKRGAFNVTVMDKWQSLPENKPRQVK